MSKIAAAPVTWKALILTSVVLVVLMSVLAGVGAYWAFHHMSARMVLHDQPAAIRLPSSLAVKAALSKAVHVRVDHDLPVRVPIDETLVLPMSQALPVKVQVQTQVPIALDVPFEHVMQIDQAIDLDTSVQTRILGFAVTVPIKGRVPLKASIPIKLVIPVRQTIPVVLDVPASVQMLDPIRARVQTVIEARVPIRESLQLPVTEPVDATLTFRDPLVHASLQRMDINLPFDAITLSPTAGWAHWWPRAAPVPTVPVKP
ncbi:MAG TPA: hypothetical protein PLS22_02465 [Aquabacterium sp.]|nr:hypothetical protein [Aquabacterium sp.]